RYNTLDFAEQNRVPTGMLLAPIGNPVPRGYSPLDTPCFLRRLVPKLKKCSLSPVRRKYKRKHLRQDREGANLPFGADNLKLAIVQFLIISFCRGREIQKQPWRISK
ncbi:MAG TPA: hypothetical protein DEP43_04195, partial [Ruminococcaceae bacterium]|nr:hypothetical protein [Oscillospiraceae bacterium]